MYTARRKLIYLVNLQPCCTVFFSPKLLSNFAERQTRVLAAHSTNILILNPRLFNNEKEMCTVNNTENMESYNAVL